LQNVEYVVFRNRLMGAEKEIASLRGVHYEDNMIPQNIVQAPPTVPLAPFDSPVHDALIRASMQVFSSR
jgi:hypothetical protein